MVRLSSGLRMTPQSPNEALQPEAPPPLPPRMPSRKRPTLSAISGFISFLVIGALAALAGLAWVTSRLHEPGPLAANKVVYILPHTDLPDILERLDSEGVIDSPLTMNVVLTVERKRRQVKAGEFLFKQHASLREVIDTLVSGKQFLHAFTIPEGLTTQQILQRIRDSDLLSGEIRDPPKEGVLLPETYKIVRGMNRSELLIKMQEDDRKVIEQVWTRRDPDLPLRSPYDLVTLASIVEKETGKADERPRVAAVFINRLRKHMRLQSDPTIVYGLVGGQGTLGHAITRSELDKKTTYNTYQIDGLPPGPITNPGRAALEAVANPSHTADLYFVADGTGGHVFADTVEEHNKNVLRWRQIERDAKDKTDIDKLAPGATTPLPPPIKGQRSEAAPSAYGDLPRSVASTSIGPITSFLEASETQAIDKVFAAEDRGPAARGGRAPAAPGASLEVASGIDGMSLNLEDPTPPAHVKAADVLDGPVSSPADAAGQAAAETRPAPPAADGRPGTKTAALDAPGAGHVDLFADPDPGPPLKAPAKPPPEHPKIFDASENTAFDPLRNKSYDLNSAKAIPSNLLH